MGTYWRKDDDRDDMTSALGFSYLYILLFFLMLILFLLVEWIFVAIIAFRLGKKLNLGSLPVLSGIVVMVLSSVICSSLVFGIGYATAPMFDISQTYDSTYTYWRYISELFLTGAIVVNAVLIPMLALSFFVWAIRWYLTPQGRDKPVLFNGLRRIWYVSSSDLRSAQRVPVTTSHSSVRSRSKSSARNSASTCARPPMRR